METKVEVTAGAVAVLVGAVFVTVLAVLAARGNMAAIVIAAILATVALIGIGAGLIIAVNAMNAKQEQENFVANARENLAIMAGLQRVQNLQTQNVMRQLPAGREATGLAFSDMQFEVLNDEVAMLGDGR